MLSLQLKRKVDSVIGAPALIALSWCARALGGLLRRSHERTPVRSIMVMKFQGIGSLALALPHIARVRAMHPKARLIFWGSPATVALARATSLFDDVHTLNDRTLTSALTSTVATLRRLWSEPLDWAFDLEVYSKLSSILLTLSCARNRAGFATSAVPSRAHLHTTLIYFNRYRHVGDSYRNLLAVCFDPSQLTTSRTAPRIPWSFDLKSTSHEFKADAFCVINANVGELAVERAWPETHFAELIKELQILKPGLAIFLIGKGENEVERNARIMAALPPHSRSGVQNLADRLSLHQWISVLHKAQFLVTADTGALHLASLVETPTVALFGPTLSQTYIAPNPLVRIVEKSVFCRPCVHHWATPPCLGDNLCMKAISVADVTSALQSLWTPTAEQSSTELSTAEEKEVFKINSPSAGVVYQRPLL